jgi:hypothetical protein
MKRIAILGLFVGALLVGAPRAEAVQLTGTISLSQSAASCPGSVCLIPVGAAGTQVGLGIATALDFTGTGSLSPNVAGPMTIDGGTGNFAGITGSGTIKDFCFRPAGGCGVYPQAPLVAWETATLSGATFDLSTVNIQFQSDAALVLTGTGVFHVAGFDATPGTFTFAPTQTGGAFSFSSTNVAAAVPEPGSMILLGTGLAGLAASVRRRLARKQ